MGGFWLLQKSKEDAVARASRVPFVDGQLEIRRVFEPAGFAPVIKTEAGRGTVTAEAPHRAKQPSA